MDTAGFESSLRAEGYQEILRRPVPAHEGLPEHEHGWDVRGLVLTGRFTVTSAGGVQDCGPGQVFTLEAGCRHTEAAGAEGAELLVGRRHKA
ncbi:cupin domain-containing protein [Paracraurococcus lichenis]|uniref:AraC family ligand binding domain-containing protein n=1 Tax=Paracraurococcus lichenis TaxID=3064888 RepID=A0ABT9E7Y4_9PROT|nr:AraC family ligand binding domain-containing protein [Paracraurococcus sp. LOR1-02]MDO9712312.1 AraC family ligand binding domain-containing protein [Paracraurococcus sp. LOR1-02]